MAERIITMIIKSSINCFEVNRGIEFRFNSGAVPGSFFKVRYLKA